jgi:Arc/MetJ-type ribon-helix-helix transcriptional regulator
MTTEYTKKNIILPKELELEIEKRLIGKYYKNLSEVIIDGLRKILSEYEKKDARGCRHNESSLAKGA